MATESKVLIVGGMHRSGTSLTAQWLAECGLFLGDDLIPADWTNPRGHFEDKGISHFQRRVLAASGVDHYCPPGPVIRPSPQHYEEARELAAARDGHAVWGFKDPRTTLLLDFWSEVLSSARFLFVFRHPSLVVDSLLRRDRSSFLNLPRWRKYLRAWSRFNDDLAAFAANNPQRALVFHVFDLLGRSEPVVDFLRERWGLPLTTVPIERVAEPELLTRKPTPRVDRFNRFLVPGVDERFARLMELHRACLRRVEAESA